MRLAPVNVGLDLAPQRRTGATSSQPYVADGHVHVLEERDGILQAEGDTFEDGPDHVSSSVVCREPDERSPSFRIEVGCALTHEIGSPQQAIGACWR